MIRHPPRSTLFPYPTLSRSMNALDIIRRSLAVLSRLVNNRRCQQLGRIEFADREPIEPSFLIARQAMKLRAANVPKLDVDARSEEHTSELQSPDHLLCPLLL